MMGESDHSFHSTLERTGSSTSIGSGSGKGRATGPFTNADSNELKVLIIGGGVAGLTAALAIKRVSAATGLNLRPIIYEADPAPTAYTTNMAQHWVLWKWAYELLLEMGLGKRLEKIARPIHATKSIEADTREILVSYPPEQLEGDPNSAAQDPEWGTETGSAGLPPMIGLRKQDLVRMLLLALSGIRDDLLDSDKFIPAPPNTTPGIEADMAADGSWFAQEGYADLVPDLMLGYELESFLISASSGTVTVKFSNGAVERGFMVIGADGTHSKVRDLLGSRRYPIQHAGAAVMHGITRLGVDRSNATEAVPTTTVDGHMITPVRPEDILRLCPEGNAVSFVGRGVAFGVNNIGNGMIGWNLVVAQPQPHFHTTQFVIAQRAKADAEVDAALAGAGSSSTGSGSGTSPTSYFQLENVTCEGVVESEANDAASRANSSANSIASVDTLIDPVTTALGTTTLDDASLSSPTPSSPGSTSRNTPRRNRMETAFERQLRLQREEIIAAKTEELYGSPTADPSRPTTNLSGSQARDLALVLASRHASLPTTVLGLIAHADSSQTHAMDILDMADQYPETYTSPNFHPGRVILIGDAAHPVATNATGSLGGGLAISDAVLLAKLIGKHLASHHLRTTAGPALANPSSALPTTLPRTSTRTPGSSTAAVLEEQLKALSQAFDAARVPVCNGIMTDARAEGGWGRVENTWMRSLWRWSWKYGTSRNWVRATYAQMLERGGVEKGLISLAKVGTPVV